MSVRTDDLRLGSLVIELQAGGNIPAGCDICIIGFPHDEGVRRNGGRVGAAEGPRHFRERYKGMGTLVNPEFNVDLRKLKIVDAGDIDPGSDRIILSVDDSLQD
jgi:formiminoglutamase